MKKCGGGTASRIPVKGRFLSRYDLLFIRYRQDENQPLVPSEYPCRRSVHSFLLLSFRIFERRMTTRGRLRCHLFRRYCRLVMYRRPQWFRRPVWCRQWWYRLQSSR